jgi:hypothetical protein
MSHGTRPISSQPYPVSHRIPTLCHMYSNKTIVQHKPQNRVSSANHVMVTTSGHSTGTTDGEPTAVSNTGEYFTATIQKPLGLILAEDFSTKQVKIESIDPGSNADAVGIFKPGDILVSCSAIMMREGDKSKSIYNRNSRGKKGGCCSTGCPDCPFNVSNWTKVDFDCRGKSFDTVVAALSSNSARWIRSNAPITITITVHRNSITS